MVPLISFSVPGVMSTADPESSEMSLKGLVLSFSTGELSYLLSSRSAASCWLPDTAGSSGVADCLGIGGSLGCGWGWGWDGTTLGGSWLGAILEDLDTSLPSRRFIPFLLRPILKMFGLSVAVEDCTSSSSFFRTGESILSSDMTSLILPSPASSNSEAAGGAMSESSSSSSFWGSDSQSRSCAASRGRG